MKNWFYHKSLWFYSFLLVTGGILLIVWDKGDFVLILNKIHYPATDLFFKYITYLGDGWIFAILLIISLFVRFYYSILLIGTVLLQTLIVQVLKRYLYADTVRPSLYFEDETIFTLFAEIGYRRTL